MNVISKIILISVLIPALLNLIPKEACAQIDSFRKEIEFVGDEKNKEMAIKIVDKSLKRHGNLGVQGDLTVGLKELSKENYITISDKTDFLHVVIAPNSEGRHDFCLKVDKNTHEIFDVVIGEIVPEPEPVDEF